MLGRKPAAQPDIDLKKQMRNAFPGAPKTEVGEVIVRATFIGGDLSAEQNSETRIGLDEGVQLTPRKGVCAHYRKAAGGVIHRSVRSRLKPEHRARQREIQDLVKTGEFRLVIVRQSRCAESAAAALPD